MYIPENFKKKIKEIFYDKTIEVLNTQNSIDDEGGFINADLEIIDSFKGNVNFSNCKEIQEEYGLDYNIDLVITTDYKLLKIDNIIKYLDIKYKVTDVIKSDSHFLIIATKWL